VQALNSNKGSLTQRREGAKKKMTMSENEIARIIVDVAFKIHTALGPGLSESVYETVLSYELTKRGLKVLRQVAIPIVYAGLQFEEGFREDLIVEDRVIVEIKTVEQIAAVHKKQLLTYLPFGRQEAGLVDKLWGNINQRRHQSGSEWPGGAVLTLFLDSRKEVNFPGRQHPR
jgi:GxxExxY protein